MTLCFKKLFLQLNFSIQLECPLLNCTFLNAIYNIIKMNKVSLVFYTCFNV